jgi:hypothetical protein
VGNGLLAQRNCAPVSKIIKDTSDSLFAFWERCGAADHRRVLASDEGGHGIKSDSKRRSGQWLHRFI